RRCLAATAPRPARDCARRRSSSRARVRALRGGDAGAQAPARASLPATGRAVARLLRPVPLQPGARPPATARHRGTYRPSLPSACRVGYVVSVLGSPDLTRRIHTAIHQLGYLRVVARTQNSAFALVAHLGTNEPCSGLDTKRRRGLLEVCP